MGIRMLDCPVSGGTIGAEEASLALLVGGDRGRSTRRCCRS